MLKTFVVFSGVGLYTDTLPVLVVRVLLHVEGAEPLGLVDEGPLVRLAQQFPLSPQPLRNLRVVHFGVLLGHLAALAPGPHHEGVHGPLHPVGVLAVVQLGRHLDVVVVGRGGGRAFVRPVGEGGGGLGYVGLVGVRRGV